MALTFDFTNWAQLCACGCVSFERERALLAIPKRMDVQYPIADRGTVWLLTRVGGSPTLRAGAVLI